MASSPRHSSEVRDVDAPSPDVPHSNASRTAPSSDGSDDEAGRKTLASAASVINVNDDSSDEEPVAEEKETDKAERGTISSRKSIGKMYILTC
jgi:hypothetical protein